MHVQLLWSEAQYAQCALISSLTYVVLAANSSSWLLACKRMPKRRNLSIEERAAVVTFSKEKYTGCAIARRLKISLCAVQKILKKVCETGTVKDRPRSGRPSFTTPRQDRLLCHLSLSDRTATSRDLKRKLEDVTGSQISCRTVRRKLLKCGLKGCIAARKPLHNAVHRKKRLEWCQQRKDWTPEQ